MEENLTIEQKTILTEKSFQNFFTQFDSIPNTIYKQIVLEELFLYLKSEKNDLFMSNSPQQEVSQHTPRVE